jgi:hypothetical protein
MLPDISAMPPGQRKRREVVPNDWTWKAQQRAGAPEMWCQSDGLSEVALLHGSASGTRGKNEHLINTAPGFRPLKLLLTHSGVIPLKIYLFVTTLLEQ